MEKSLLPSSLLYDRGRAGNIPALPFYPLLNKIILFNKEGNLYEYYRKICSMVFRIACQFERDFQLEGRYIDEQHAVMLWYGDAEGELGEVRRASNHSLDPGFDRLTEAVEQRLTELEITRISYLLAIPELEYSENVTHNHTLHFAGHVQYESALSDWMQDLLDEL